MADNMADDDDDDDGKNCEDVKMAVASVNVKEEEDDDDGDDEPMKTDAQAATVKTETKTEVVIADADADGNDENMVGDGNEDEDGKDDDDGGKDGEEDEDNASDDDDDDDDDDSQEEGSSSEIDDNSEDDDDDDEDSDSDNDDDDDDDNGEENQNQNQNNDGLSEYERLRLARIKRNQERLAALGLAQGTGVFGGSSQKKKSKKNKKKIDLDSEPIVRSRNSISRSSKKQIDYAEQPKLHELKEYSSKRKKNDNNSNKRNERVPLVVYQEFQRLKSKRRIGFNKAKTHKRKSERELKYWTKAVNKIVIEETRQKEMNEREMKLRQKREMYQKQIDNEKLNYCGYTKLEILHDIQSRIPQLYNQIYQHEGLRTKSIMLLKQQQMKQIEISKRIILERKMHMIDIIDKYPKFMNDRLHQLNTLLYSRIPPTTISASSSRTSSRRKTYDSSITIAKQSATATTTTTVVLKKKTKKKSLSSSSSSSSSSLLKQQLVQQEQQKRSSQQQQLEPPPKKKQKRTSGSTSTSSERKPPPVPATTKKITTKKRGRSMPPLPLKDAHDADTISGIGAGSPAVGAGSPANIAANDLTILAATLTSDPPPIATATATATATSATTTSTTTTTGGTSPVLPFSTTTTDANSAAAAAAAGTTTTTTTANTVDPSSSSSSSQQKKKAAPPPPTIKTKTASNNNKKITSGKSSTSTSTSNNNNSKKKQQQQSKGSPKPDSSSSNNPKRKSSKGATATTDSKSSSISGISTNNGNNDIKINKKKRKQQGDSSTAPPTPPTPPTSTPRKSKTKDGRYVGGWMSPHFSQELDRSWLERTKPLTKITVVPEDVANRCVGLSSVKKTAVFDLKNYVPQVGDIILYYPSSHKDFLDVYPDTLGRRQRQLIRVPIWNRAHRERNRLSKEEQENGKIWWTDEWIESLLTVRKSKKERALEEAAKASTSGFKEGKDINDKSMPPPAPTTTSLGDYPIICRVERTHNEFPEDPYAKEKSITTKDGSTGGGDMAIMSWSKAAARTLSPAVAEAKKKNGMCPQIRLAVTLRPLSPVVAPDNINVSSLLSSPSQSTSTSYRLELAPNFTIVTCPGKCEPFLVPFCWGYTTFHTLSIGESVWIQRSVNDDHNEDDSDTKKAGRSANMCGKGKIIDFFLGEKEKSKTRAAAGMEKEEEKVPALSPSSSPSPSPSPLRPAPTRGINHSVRLEDSIDDVETILASLSKEGLPVPQTNENELKFSIPNRETKIIVNFLGLYLKKLKSQQAGNNSDFNKRPAAVNGPSSLSSTPPDSSSNASAVNMSSPLSLIDLILKTLPLRQGVSVSYESNRRQLYRTSPWTLVTLQPSDLSRMLQEGVLGTLENSMKEKAILFFNDVIDNNPHAKIFVPIVTDLVAPGYSMCVPVSISLGRILSRLKTNFYTSMESILGDLHLISENCLLFNSPESELVAHCNDIVQQCQRNIKAIIQNVYVKIERNDLGGSTKRNAIAIPSDLNTPYKGNVHGDWLKQIAPDGTCVEVGKRTRHVAASSWIPQVGDSILYSRSNHSAFVYGHRDSLADVQCNVPQFQKIETKEKKISTAEENTYGECATLHENKRSSEENGEDDFFEKTSSHWMKGTVVSVRSSFPRNMTNKIKESFTIVTPILIVELRLQYSRCDGTMFVCWRPCLFSKLDTSKCKLCKNTKYSFLKPAWISSTDEMQILPPDSPQGHEFTSGLPKDTIISIEKCFDFLKHRCINSMNQDAFAVNPDSALENAERGVTINLNLQSIPSYIDFFSPLDAKYVSRGIKKAECKDTLKNLSSVGYMPLWSLEAQHPTLTEKNKTLRHDSRMPFPSLCLELIRLRITSGYYRNKKSVVNDISESYVASVLYLLSEPSTRKNDRVSIRKIAKFCLSGKGNGKMSKIPIKKISKKKKNKNEEVAAPALAPTDKKPTKKGSQESLFDGLSDEEKSLTRQIFQIRMYHAAAIVFALNANQMEKLFCLKSMVASPTQAPEPIPDISAIDNANFTQEQLAGIQDIRNLLNAIGRDLCRNRFKFSYRNTYKLKIKCEGQIITQNGSLFETNEGGSFLYEPAGTIALLPNGSHVNLQIRCGNQYIHAEKRRISVESESLTNELNHTGISNVSQPIDTARSISSYPSSMIGQDHFIFSWPELKNNEELVRTLFCSKGRMNACVMCQATGISLLDCRVRKCHSNPDYAFNERFKGTNGYDSLLLPWTQTQDNHEIAANAPSNVTATASNQPLVTDTTSEIQRVKKEAAVAFAKQASEVKESFIKADKAFKLAGYLYNQADLLKQAKLKLSEDFIKNNFPFDPEDNHYVFCIHCGCAGDLLICDGCPNVSHPKCVGLTEVPSDDWFCIKCENAKPKCNAIDKLDRTIQNDDKKQEDDACSKKPPSQKEETCVVGSNHSGSTKSAPGEIDSTEITTEFSSLPNCTDSVVKDDEINHRDESKEMSMDTNLSTNPLPSTSTYEGVDSNKGAAANESKNEAIPQAMPAVVAPDNSEAKVTQSSTETDQPAQTIAPEIDDLEFDEKESELEKLLAELINQRAPPEVKSKSQAANEKQTSQTDEVEDDTTKSSLSDPIDALGDTTTWVRQFLSFILIKSGSELLSAKSGAIVKDMEMWRKEKGMKPLSGTGYLSTVSGWKATVRKAGTNIDYKEKEDDDNFSDANEVIPQKKSRSGKRKRSVDSLQSLPNQGRRFCASIGIADAEEFLATRSSTLSKKYASWRKREGMPVLQGSRTGAYIGQWKTKLRKDIETSSQKVMELAIPPGCQVPIGFKVRKLFEDENYYDGQVISGPSTAFDKDQNKFMSCWRVKYVDDDEEEFSLEELNMWAVASIPVTTGNNQDENEDDVDDKQDIPNSKRIKLTGINE